MDIFIYFTALNIVNMSSSGEDVAADVSGHMGAEEKEDSVELLVCECYVEDREKEEVVFENEAVTKKVEEEEEVVTKEEDGDDTQSLDNETGSCYRGNATCRWNESMFDKNDSIYKVSMPQSFYELNSSTSKHDDNDTLSDSTKDKSKVENIAKVESWLSKESSNLMSFSFKQARGLLMLQLVYLNKLCLFNFFYNTKRDH